MYRSVIFALSILAIIAANPAMAFGPPPPPQATVSGCTSGWNSSPASQTCERQATHVINNKCAFGTICTFKTSTGNDRGDASISGVSEGDASRINHCPPRTLKVGSC